MPLYHLQCTSCGATKRRIIEPNQVKDQRCDCGGEMKRTPKPPSTQVMESLDNGLMAKRVERLSNAPELYHDRAERDPRYSR